MAVVNVVTTHAAVPPEARPSLAAKPATFLDAADGNLIVGGEPASLAGLRELIALGD